MYWRLTDSITACVSAGRVLFLDVARDRYFALPPEDNEELASWLAPGTQRKLPVRLGRRLAAHGIIGSHAAGQLAPIPCPLVMPSPVDAEALPVIRPHARRALRIAGAILSAWRDVRRKPLAAVLASRFADAAGEAGADRDRRIAEFRAVRPFVPVPRVCLHDCLALIDWLGGRRSGARLVLGVTAFPFGAHCWVEVEGRVIDDHPESPSRFQPILALP